MATQATAQAEGDYPVTFDVEYPEVGNRFLILVRWILAIPHLIVLYFLGIVASVLVFIALLTLLFTRTYPAGMYRFVAGVMRWQQNVMSYVLFRDEYPPFSLDEGAYAPVSFAVDQPAEFSRWLPLVKWLLAIPHMIVMSALQFVALFVGLYMVVIVLVTGRYPRGAFDFLVGVGRWSVRVNSYLFLLVDRYPPFSLR
jgi:hypothetical protein